MSLSIGGCNTTRPDTLVLYPDAPLLVTEAKDGRLRVSAYDPEENALVDYGWVSTGGLPGWTITRFDWPAYIESRR